MIVFPVRAISLDANGTLIHSPRMGEIYSEVLGRHGLEVSGDDAMRVVRQVWQEFTCSTRLGEDRFAEHPEGARGWWYRFVHRVCEHLGSDSPSRFAGVELFQRFASAASWEVYEEVPEVLGSLRGQGLRLLVLSNWDERLPALLEELQLSDFFESVVFSAAVGFEKPYPGIFHQALAQLGLPAEQVVHVGDSELEDAEGARAVGMQALLLSRHDGDGDLQDLRPLVELARGGRLLGR